MNSEYNFVFKTPKRRRKRLEISTEEVNEDKDNDEGEGDNLAAPDPIGDSVIADDQSSVVSEDRSFCVVNNDKSNEKLFRKLMIQEKRRAISLYSKDQLMRVCCNAFAYHRFNSAAKLMPALVRDQRTSHLFIRNAAFILLTQYSSHSDLLSKAMKTVTKYDINKREVMLEMILHFIQTNDLIGAKQYIESNESYLKSNAFRNDPVIDPILKCYIYFIYYKEWKQSVEESNDKIVYHSNRLIGEKAKLSLRNIITETKDLDLDYFVLILIEMYEYSQQFSEAFEILQVYVENNPSNVNAYIYLYNFGVKYPGYSTPESQTNALENIHKFSPENPLVLNLVEKKDQIIKKFAILMDFIDYRANRTDIKGWTQLKDFIISYEDINVKQIIKDYWTKVYEEYWVRLHCRVGKVEQMNENTIELIGCKQIIVAFFYDSSHLYIIQTNQMIDEYRSLIDF